MKGSQIRKERRLCRRYGPDIRKKWHEVPYEKPHGLSMVLREEIYAVRYDSLPRRERDVLKRIFRFDYPLPDFEAGE